MSSKDGRNRPAALGGHVINALFDHTHAELDAVRAEIKAARQQQRRISRLDRFKGELLSFQSAGASIRELAFWLRTRKQVTVHPTTILRRLQQWRQEAAD